jgi:Zn ribbon nucleic-acid-binding protein
MTKVIARCDSVVILKEVVFGYDSFFAECHKCGWKSRRFSSSVGPVLPASLHDCDPEKDYCVHCGFEVSDEGTDQLLHVYNAISSCPTNHDYCAELVNGDSELS